MGHYNAKVETVHNGLEAVKCVKQSPEGTFDAVLMDIRMSVMDDLDATKAICGLNRNDVKHLPIVAMTANAYTEDEEKAWLRE